MVRLREFAGVSVAVSIVMGMAVFAKSPQYRTDVAPIVAQAGKGFAAAGAAISAQTAAFTGKAAAPGDRRVIVQSAPASAVRPATMIRVTAPQVLRPQAIAVAVTPAPLPDGVSAAVPPAPQTIEPDPAQLANESGAVARRIELLVPARLAAYFDLYLYVSKAREGSWAQRLFLFHKSGDGALVFEDSFLVSTGRERREKYFTVTPVGLFELDPDRFQPMHISRTWDNAKMPWSMFFNYRVGDHMAGIALHAAIGQREDADLGHRASGGCVRLPLEKADLLYHRFQAEERGMVPVLAFDAGRNTSSVSGDIAQDGAGNDLISEGYRVLVVIDDYPGPSEPALVSQEVQPQSGKSRLFLASVNIKTDPDWDKRACFG
jgi:hypothetical protein